MKKIFILLFLITGMLATIFINSNGISVNAETGEEENYIQPAYGDDEPVIAGEESIFDRDDYEGNNSYKNATNISTNATGQPNDNSNSINATLHAVNWFFGIWRTVDEDYYRIDLFGDAYLELDLDVPNDVNYNMELYYHTDYLDTGFNIDDLPKIGKANSGGVGISESIDIKGNDTVNNNNSGVTKLTAGTYYVRVYSYNELYDSGDEYTLSYTIDYQPVANEQIDQLRFNKGASAAIWKSDFDPYGFETFRFDGELPITGSENPFHDVMETYSTSNGIVNSVLYIWNTEWRNELADYIDDILEVYIAVNDRNQNVQVVVEVFEDATGAIGTIVNIVGKATGYPIVELVGDGISTGGEVIAALVKLLFPEVWETTLQEAIDYFELLSDTLRCTNNVDSTEVIEIECKYKYEETTISFTPSLSENENFVYASNYINAYNSESHTYGKVYPLVSFDDYNDFMNTGYVDEKEDINTCYPININLDQNKEGNLISGKYYWYKFTAPVTGEYTFQTTGSTDTYGELFSSAVPARSIENRLTNGYNDDAGEGYNFLLSYNLEASQTVYLRVRGYGWTKTGEFNVTVETDAHVHDYTYSYEQNTSLNHYAYCECGAYITEIHNYSNNVCIDCGYVHSHTHSYTYRSNGNGRTHSKVCSCGISTTESCIGLVQIGEATRCAKCNQVMSSSPIFPFSNDNEYNEIDEYYLNEVIPYFEKNDEY